MNFSVYRWSTRIHTNLAGIQWLKDFLLLGEGIVKLDHMKKSTIKNIVKDMLYYSFIQAFPVVLTYIKTYANIQIPDGVNDI